VVDQRELVRLAEQVDDQRRLLAVARLSVLLLQTHLKSHLLSKKIC